MEIVNNILEIFLKYIKIYIKCFTILKLLINNLNNYTSIIN